MDETVKQFISKHASKDKTEQRIKIFEAVRDFLYQINDAKTAEKLLDCKEGYCVPKHRLLKEIYEELGYRTELCFVPFKFGMGYLPDNLKDKGLANKKGYHVFLRLWIDGNAVDIDATYNKELKDFYVVNEDRDGISSQKMICEIKEIYIHKNQDEEFEIKKKLSDPGGFTDEDIEWIREYNNRIKKTSAI